MIVSSKYEMQKTLASIHWGWKYLGGGGGGGGGGGQNIIRYFDPWVELG